MESREGGAGKKVRGGKQLVDAGLERRADAGGRLSRAPLLLGFSVNHMLRISVNLPVVANERDLFFGRSNGFVASRGKGRESSFFGFGGETLPKWLVSFAQTEKGSRPASFQRKPVSEYEYEYEQIVWERTGITDIIGLTSSVKEYMLCLP
jgi:hypothetical protein